MSKKLDSILGKVPPATSQNIVQEELTIKSIPEEIDRYERIVAEVPLSLKKQIKQYAIDNPGNTERTVLLKALKNFGFSIEEIHFKDRRGRR